MNDYTYQKLRKCSKQSNNNSEITGGVSVNDFGAFHQKIKPLEYCQIELNGN